mmetsp:Transcript_26667/g.43605  ORF Transcript_26667/g.43605 Transcript_26667/m.43605 type:complete len:520 (-) Transcript_26667:621-2180(-)|eukprot:CAMPEP_0184653982 /NCGR_PEP_ID=MMETSP0308-20130426/11683_1 /TAXON_ID=38269 /ORGANISM="Gloeochaete witrockiana, Strain SAG 46.84" /LENGTH=519 /DNA_ID=CAMNT_0027089725 /DNA_START=36 /DNA_END=1595 /DNA_ORIENTATION=+
MAHSLHALPSEMKVETSHRNTAFSAVSPQWTDGKSESQIREIAQLKEELAKSRAEIEMLRRRVSELERGTDRRNSARKRKPSLSSTLSSEEQAAVAQLKSQSRYWTPEEHKRFISALKAYGPRDIKGIAMHVGTRNPTQVRTHAQKYWMKLKREQQKHAGKMKHDDAALYSLLGCEEGESIHVEDLAAMCDGKSDGEESSMLSSSGEESSVLRKAEKRPEQRAGGAANSRAMQNGGGGGGKRGARRQGPTHASTMGILQTILSAESAATVTGTSSSTSNNKNVNLSRNSSFTDLHKESATHLKGTHLKGGFHKSASTTHLPSLPLLSGFTNNSSGPSSPLPSGAYPPHTTTTTVIASDMSPTSPSLFEWEHSPPSMSTMSTTSFASPSNSSTNAKIVEVAHAPQGEPDSTTDDPLSFLLDSSTDGCFSEDVLSPLATDIAKSTQPPKGKGFFALRAPSGVSIVHTGFAEDGQGSFDLEPMLTAAANAAAMKKSWSSGSLNGLTQMMGRSWSSGNLTTYG